MANELSKKTVAAGNPGPAAGKTNPLEVAAGIIAGQPVPSPAPVAAPARESVPLFGGHRGGGKKRADGLVAGSPEAIKADKEADAERKRLARQSKKVTPLPPPLPGAVAPPENAVAGGDLPVPVAPGGPGPVAVAPLFVPWSQKLLEKPAKLVGKIIDRWRSISRAAQIRKLKLSPPAEKEILDRMKWREEVTNDFSLALAEAATVELNKRRVGGSENSHWINLAMCTGELVALEMANHELIEKLILEDRAKEKAAAEKTA